ncbi:MAG: hypothetical protein HYW26_04075 [Candidatus Aenigmarchaeota archaeon]|nr:hypothetical protein [Candidatus Aenigmarchaeota archaeon]
MGVAKPKSNVVLGAVVIAAVFVAGLIYVQFTKQNEVADNYQVAPPEEVVRQYFTSWNNRDWPNMYATLSDGFKKIDPNAKDLAAFRNFASSQGIEGVNIISIKEESNDGTTASVVYSIEFTLSNGSKRPFSDRFTLKFRQGDIIPGWKLIHPYGPNIDTS